MKTLFTLLAFVFYITVEAQFITTFAGSGKTGVGKGGYSGDGGLGIAAQLNGPYKICSDAAGTIYFADCSNHCVRKIDANGIITTIAGTGNNWFSGDGGPATAANLQFPSGVCLDAAGNIYIADLGNNRIRKIDTGGIINTIAGSGLLGFGNGSYSGDGGPAVLATLNSPISMVVDAAGNVLIADTYNNCIRKVNTNGIITTIAGTGTKGYGGDGGQASLAMLDQPSDLMIDVAGNLLIADYANCRIRKINMSGIITTIAGSGSPGYSGDGAPAMNADMNGPADVDMDAAGNIYITDMHNHCVRKVDASGIITTLAGSPFYGYSGDGGPASAAELFLPSGLNINTGRIYIADQLNHRIRMICSSVVSLSVSASTTLILCAGNPAALTVSGANTYTYTWSTAQTGINTITVTPGITTPYYVQGKDTSGCAGSDSTTLFVDPCLGFGEASNGDQITIYPNPARSELTINYSGSANATSKITIINSLGQVVRSMTAYENSTAVYKIDVADLKKGPYFIRFENGPKIVTKLFNKIE